MSMKNSKARDCYVERVRKSLLGPGAENELWGLESDSEEIISDYPLVRYYTGILFPQKKTKSDEIDFEESVEDDSESLYNENIEEEISADEPKKKEEGDSILKVGQNNFYPSSCAMTFCVEQSTKTIDIDVSFGLYYEPKQTDIKIAISKEGYDSFINNPAFPLKDELKYDGRYMFLSRELKGNKKRRDASGDYARIYDFKSSDSFKYSQTKFFFHLFERLYGRAWKRKQICEKLTLEVSPSEDDKDGRIVYREEVSATQSVIAKIYTKRYEYKGNVYFKVLLSNNSTEQARNRFTTQTNELNKKAFFQVQIKAQSEHFLPYRSREELNPIDSEENLLNFVYRDVHSYAIGHNCAVMWDRNENSKPYEIRTTFLPKYQVLDVRNDLNESDFETVDEFKQISECLSIRSLSHFEAKKEETINRLKIFVGLYAKWIEGQISKAEDVGKQYQEVAQTIIKKLNGNLQRLYCNIDSLNDDRVFRAFTLANTAMLMQIIISNDEKFAKKEKLLSEIDALGNLYNSLDYFAKTDLKIKPAYRPFQLAFLLLNINSITQYDSKERNDIVDLIWFPTGGGKTEAYLAVAAFSIIWRRLTNDEGYEGTAVIMRYTLRLLTAQQFERASRLIAALEFLRKNFDKELKSDPITIGLWVGNSSTPNKIKEANDICDKINNEASKNEDGKPNAKNTFQVTSCPWCGAKLVNRYANGQWNLDAFDYGRNKFYFKCPNSQCTYKDRLPIQVVDEMLYKEPPTLLFATVDKFAMLAWQEFGHTFFNSLSDKGLPPELIIQDELHLLSGALGSITAIFESVVEMLSTKHGRKPKILASTATTRNTDYQIRQLYGNREVNVFPPMGLSYNDSFFSREAKTSKRKYVGFMPTGKTAVDCQLRLIANLLVARMDIYRNPQLREKCFNNYWSIVSYYNSLKDVGRTNNKLGDEITTFTTSLQKRLFGDTNSYDFNYEGLKGRVRELTSRESSDRIKQTLKELETSISVEDNIINKGESKRIAGKVIDLILATNMISVGIDISRLNIMLVNGQPKNIAEYIQATSRVGRKEAGLVISLYDSNRARDKSYFEHFMPFHQAFYKFVEPLSLTPFTENTIDKMLMSMVVTFVRHKIKKRNGNKDVINFKKEDLEEFISEIESRFGKNPYFTSRIEKLRKEWEEGILKNRFSKYDDNEDGLIFKPQRKNSNNKDRVVMQSMRDVDTNTFVKILPTSKRIK